MKPTRYRKATVELVDASKARVRFTCLSCGHQHTKQIKIGPRGMRRPMSPDAVEMMVKVWQGYGRTNHKCPKCSPKE